MPIFEFKCKKCNYEFEAIVRNSRAAVSCQKCGSDDVIKKLPKIAVPASGSSSADFCEHASQCSDTQKHSCGCSGCCHGHH